MRNIFVALAFALALAGCTATQQLDTSGLTPSERVFVLKRDFQLQLAQVQTYARQPTCSPEIVVGCKDPDVLSALARIVVRIDNALDAAEVIARGGGDPGAQLGLARSAYVELVNTMAARGVLGEQT